MSEIISRPSNEAYRSGWDRVFLYKRTDTVLVTKKYEMSTKMPPRLLALISDNPKVVEAVRYRDHYERISWK